MQKWGIFGKLSTFDLILKIKPRDKIKIGSKIWNNTLKVKGNFSEIISTFKCNKMCKGKIRRDKNFKIFAVLFVKRRKGSKNSKPTNAQSIIPIVGTLPKIELPKITLHLHQSASIAVVSIAKEQAEINSEDSIILWKIVYPFNKFEETLKDKYETISHPEISTGVVPKILIIGKCIS